MNDRLALELIEVAWIMLSEIVQGRFREDKGFLFRCTEII